jgi:UDP-arabinose 4-epimerase
MRNILVTGGAGYIGSHACKALFKAGYSPIAYDNLSYGHKWAVKWGPLERGDILDRARLDEVIRRYNPSAIMHFAAYAYVGESVAEPGKYYKNNVLGSLILLEAARDHKISSFVFSSSCATYGIPHNFPINEKHAQNPINPYGATKLMVERMLADFGVAHDLQSVSLRYFNAAGADPDGDIGESHDPETHLIPLVLDAAAGTKPMITIFGSDYDTPDGTCIRDYVHVTDLADAHVLALQALEQGMSTTAFNLGNGQGFSVQQLIDVAGRITGKKIPVEKGSRRVGDPARLVGDASKAAECICWNPKFPDLDQIISTAWNWHQR